MNKEVLEFITELKKSSYYKRFILNEDVLCLYIGGSTATSFRDECSDYDLVAITLHGKVVDVDNELHLRYKGKKVHWYYWPIEDFFNFSKEDNIWLPGYIYLKNITSDLIIYQNDKYSNLITKLFSMSEQLSILATYELFKTKKADLEVIIDSNDLFILGASKYFYHLCLSAQYLTKAKLPTNTLRNLKNIFKWPQESIQQNEVIDYLVASLDYINNHPIDVAQELDKLATELFYEYGNLILESSTDKVTKEES